MGHGLLVLVYEKADDAAASAAVLTVRHAVFIAAGRTGDFTTTRILRQALEAGANAEDLVSIMLDRNLPLDEVEAGAIAERLLREPCPQGYLTVSNALQWRLAYSRAIAEAGAAEGVERLR